MLWFASPLFLPKLNVHMFMTSWGKNSKKTFTRSGISDEGDSFLSSQTVRDVAVVRNNFEIAIDTDPSCSGKVCLYV